MRLRDWTVSVFDQASLQILAGFRHASHRTRQALGRKQRKLLCLRSRTELATNKTDKVGYDQYYKRQRGTLSFPDDADEYIRRFESYNLKPYCRGGNTKGYVRGLAVRQLLKAVRQCSLTPRGVTILDAGCGIGKLSVYLACKGFNVIGVDISEEGCWAAEQLAQRLAVSRNCKFLPQSLEKLSVPDHSVDFIIGHGALHHFIKYEGVPEEFMRIMKNGSKAFFADSYGENWLYHLCHDKQKMEKLGDVILTKRLITNYFHQFDVELVPTDWFVMLDKLYLRVVPKKFEPTVRYLSRIHFGLDRKIPSSNRLGLFCCGSVMTCITKIARA